MSWLNDLLRHLQKTEAPAQTQTQVENHMVRHLANSLQHTYDQEVSCEQAYQLLDQFAEAITKGKDAAALMPLVQSHLDLCADCREEFEMLLAILGISPEET